MTSIAVTNIEVMLSGDLEEPIIDGCDTIICRDGLIAGIGSRDRLNEEIEAADVVVDAVGTTVAPGLIDSHCHVVLGDYTPRQKTVDFLDSYVHGGITSVVSPGEIHAQGRPHDATGVKALAIAARSCFANFSPNGMHVHAGSVVLEPTLREEDFADLSQAGVRYAKFGFGLYSDPADGVDQVRWAQHHELIVMCHSGGASIPGSKPISTDHLLLLRPDVCGHINGGPTSLDEGGIRTLITETGLALQLVQAGNLRSSLRICEMVGEVGAFERVVIGSDTPTGTGVMPLGVIKTVAELSSLTDLRPEQVWALATGNNGKVFDLPAGVLAVSKPADLVVMDAPWGSLAKDALGALGRGDIPGISAVVTDGTVRVLRSRNTPAAARSARVEPAMPWLPSGH